MENYKEIIKDKIINIEKNKLEYIIFEIFKSFGHTKIITKENMSLSQPVIKLTHRKKPVGIFLMYKYIKKINYHENNIYISTGGFTKNAKIMAINSNAKINLLDIYDLIEFVLSEFHILPFIDHSENS